MSSRKVAPDAEELLAQAGWVERLARKLVRDGAAAEDVVQDTWTAALQSAPASEGRLRPWLARVVHNFAQQSQRLDANRVRREAEAARPERTPPASETAERLEAQRLLVEALESLAEPYRTTVTLRYLEGLSAARIARRLGVPAGTVRWRLKQGLDELRAKLDKRFGEDRKSWALALLPLLRRPALPAAAAAAIEGVMTMSTSAKVGAGVLVLAAGVGVYLVKDRTGLVTTRVTIADAAVAPPQLSDASEPAAGGALSSLQRASARERAAESTGAAEAPSTRVEARIVDADARPVAGAHLEFEIREPYRADSGPDGGCAVEVKAQELDEGREIEFMASGANRATKFVQATVHRGQTTWLGDIALLPGGSIAGTVLGPDGKPFAGAHVRVAQADSSDATEVTRSTGPLSPRGPSATSAADGSFQIDGVPTVAVRVWARDKSRRWTFSDPIEVQASEVRCGIELRFDALSDTDRIEGVVLAPDGSPVAGARLFARWRSPKGGGGMSSTRSTKADGHFRYDVREQAPQDLGVVDTQGRWPAFRSDGVASGTLDLVLRFFEPRWVELIVRGKNGAEIEKFQVKIEDERWIEMPGWMSVENQPTDQGRIMLPGLPFVLQIAARGFALLRLGPIDPASVSSPWVLEMDPIPFFRGRVTAAGRPLAGARVALREIAPESQWVEHNAFPSRLLPKDLDKMVTESDGTFRLDQRPGNSFAILCDAKGFAAAEVSPISSSETRSIEIALDEGGSIDGRVLPPPRHEAAGTLVAATRFDGRPFLQRVGPDGRFSFARLTPGRWKVQRAAPEVEGDESSTIGEHGDPPSERLAWNCTVVTGETTHFDLDLTLSPTLELDVTVNGKPASEWTAEIRPDKDTFSWHGQFPSGEVNPEGRTQIEIPDPDAYRILLHPPAEFGKHGEFLGKFEIHGGENQISVALHTGSLRGKLASPDPECQIDYSWQHGNWTFRISGAPNAAGRFDFPIVAAGTGTLTRTVKTEGHTAESSRPVQVPEGGAVEVEAP